MKRHRDGTWSEKARFTLDSKDTIPSLFLRRAHMRPNEVAVEERSEVGASQHLTTAQIQQDVDDIAKGLIARGIQPGQTVGVLSATSYSWMLLDLAILSIGAITVPIYESDSAAQIRHILEDAGIVYVVTATLQQADLVSSVATPHVLAIEAVDSGAIRNLITAGQNTASQLLYQRRALIDIDDMATIIYTSGTTGKPKGVILTHRNFVALIRSIQQALPEVVQTKETRLLLFLPLAHVFGRFAMHLVLAGSGVIAFSPDVKRLLPDIEAFQPSVLLAVPRVLEKVYNAAAAKAGGGLKGKIFSWAAHQARRYTTKSHTRLGPSPLLRLRHLVADKLVLHKIRDLLGPRLKYVISGGAPLTTDLIRFYEGIGLTVIQGYGLSETTGPITGQWLGNNSIGTVGSVLPGNSIKIAPDGEILMKGLFVTPGYFNLPQETAAAIRDGWFHSGDLGSIDKRGQLTITGRKKELIVTAGGKNVSPEVLEDQLATHPLIGTIIVVGEARPYISALITLDHDMLPIWLKNHGLPPTGIAEAAHLPEVRASLDRAIAKANKSVSRAESIRRYRIIDAMFTVDNGYLTPSLKLRRSRVLADFAHEIDALYREGEAEKRNGKNR
ncbi:AMP-dependent synthetase/ligase [Schaalia sp. lx-260]|uniref:AMP-dependent synthetase/ligase n=1 Tax=Schaalia sp. lx-260 TaxID=2899082 RepID=UPI001E45AE5D|nr:long-chain fatty acid--CoA ligase [Schaalia sp. lx-260]MCD4549356.1 long-chain fatty acid--CoA ligase [Schaalia sp. lx-260]